MAGIATPPAEGRWDLAAWDGGPDGTPVGVWDGDASSSGLPLLRPGGAIASGRMRGVATVTPRAGSATVNRRPGNAGGGGRV